MNMQTTVSTHLCHLAQALGFALEETWLTWRCALSPRIYYGIST